ncbi:hypothetical protein GF324_12385 [bacterium]|nr:hypothetical protein [bacterium]
MYDRRLKKMPGQAGTIVDGTDMYFSRVSSGLDFVDATIGGLFSDRVYYARGGQESGRTPFVFQFLLAGMEHGELGLMISDERIENLVLRAEKLGLPLTQHLSENKIILMEYPKQIAGRQFSFGTIIQLLGEIEQYIRHYGISRLVFNTLHPLLSTPRESQLVNYVYSLMNSIEELNTTTLITTGDPNSRAASKIMQILEDAAVGVFHFERKTADTGNFYHMDVLKMVDKLEPPNHFIMRIQPGVGFVEAVDEEAKAKPKEPPKLSAELLEEIPIRMVGFGLDEDTAEDLKQAFHPKSELMQVDSFDELQPMLHALDSDLFVTAVEPDDESWKSLVEQLREAYPRLPIFLLVDKKSLKLTGQVARSFGADGLFHKPLKKKDLIFAFLKSLSIYRMEESLMRLRKPELLETTEVDKPLRHEEDGAENDGEMNLLSPVEFKSAVARQILQCRQTDEKFAIVSFKSVYISDLVNHPELPKGIELVRKVAGITTNSLRALNDRTGRYMDKVLVLLENTDREGAASFTNRVVNDLKEELQTRLGIEVGKQVNILTASAVYPDDGDNVNSLMVQVTDVAGKSTAIHL